MSKVLSFFSSFLRRNAVDIQNGPFYGFELSKLCYLVIKNTW